MTEPMKAPALPEVQGQQAAFLKYHPHADALPEEKVKQRGDVILARENFLRGLGNVSDHKAQLEGKWPKARIEQLETQADLVHGALFAASRAAQLDTSDGALRPLIAETYAKREMTLKALEAAAAFGLVPAERVAHIRAGKGPLNAGQDLVDSAALYRDYQEALAGKTPITPAFLGEIETLGNRVTLLLTPSDARERLDADAKKAADLANRFWTLLVGLHAELRRAGYELWGDGVDAFVPQLQSRQLPAHPAPEPTPAPA